MPTDPSSQEVAVVQEDSAQAIKNRAKAMYLERIPIREICRELNLTSRQLQRWRTEGDWTMEREADDRALIEDGFSGRKVKASNVATLATEQLERGLMHIARRQDPPTLQECERLATIVSTIDKISRLDMGKATDNINVNANLHMTADEIRTTILANPFFSPATAAEGEEKPVE